MYIDSISKRFDLDIFHNITFKFMKGKYYAIFGKNGSGKTTLLNIMNGNIKQDSGDSDFDKYKVVFIRNNSIPFPYMSAMDFIIQTCNLKSIKWNKSKIIKLVDEFGLSGREHELLITYSKGMQYKILLIIALLSDVDILLLDEPFSELDFITMNKMKNLFDVYLNKVTIIFSCHSIEIASKVADEFLFLSSRELKTIASKEDFENIKKLEESLINEMNNGGNINGKI